MPMTHPERKKRAERIIQKYRDGITVDQIVNEEGLTRFYVRLLLRRAGEKPPKAKPGGPRKQPIAKQTQQIEAALRAGHSPAAVASEFGVSRQWVHHVKTRLWARLEGRHEEKRKRFTAS